MEDNLPLMEDNGRGSDWYRKLVEEVNDLATVIDTDGTITYVSPAVRRVLGYGPDELIGHVANEFTHPDDQIAYERHLIDAHGETPRYTASIAYRTVRQRLRLK